MKNFTCHATQSKLHRWIVDIRIGSAMLVVSPAGTDEASAREIADFINQKVRDIQPASLTPGIPFIDLPSVKQRN